MATSKRSRLRPAGAALESARFRTGKPLYTFPGNALSSAWLGSGMQMVADWYDGFVLHSEYLPGEGNGRYGLVLTNCGTEPAEGFVLGLSGPVRINGQGAVHNGRIITQLSNYAELAPPAGFVLEPGADWIVEVDRLDFPLRHWTDGAVTGFVILTDGKVVPAITFPLQGAGSAAYRRGLPGAGGAAPPGPRGAVSDHGRGGR